MDLQEHTEEQEVHKLLREVMGRLENIVHPEPKVYTIVEVAKILKCKESTVKNLIHRTHELSACLIGRELRIREEDLKKFLANRSTPTIYDKGVLR